MTITVDLLSLRRRLAPYGDDLLAFTQRLLQTPSLPGQEQDVAALVRAEIERLHFDEVWTDEAGNVIGRLRGATSEHSLVLNGHMDHVSPGSETAWQYPPYGGAIAGGLMYGRGAVDMKASVASMVYGAGALHSLGMTPPWDVYVAAVVFEEQGGIGTEVLLRHVHPDFCVIGEATGNRLSLGHRGANGMFVEITGRASHASLVNVGINPHFSAARFLLRLGELEHLSDPILGPSTVAPTVYTTDQTSLNVIPGLVRFYLDWRLVPGERPEAVLAQVNDLLQSCLEPGVTARVLPRHVQSKTYTGMAFATPASKLAVKLDPESELARRSRHALEQALGRPVEQMVWRFCSDGAVCALFGVPIVGFGPGEPELAHTADEHVPIDQVREAMVGNAALALSSGLAGFS